YSLVPSAVRDACTPSGWIHWHRTASLLYSLAALQPRCSTASLLDVYSARSIPERPVSFSKGFPVLFFAIPRILFRISSVYGPDFYDQRDYLHPNCRSARPPRRARRLSLT